MSKNWVTYTNRRVSYGGFESFQCSFITLFRSVQVIGNLVCGSGFEDVVFQSSMMKNGCIKGIPSGSDYNSTWIVHNVVSEALECLLLTCFLTEVSGENIHWLK